MGDWRAEVVMQDLRKSNIDGRVEVSPGEEIEPQPDGSLPTYKPHASCAKPVSNIIKHSGATHAAWLAATFVKGDFQVVIQDNGQGHPH